jgi:site-specific DNA-cytosine methylase
MALRSPRVLSLCAGGGALDLAVEFATDLRARTVCYIERDSFAAAVLMARMENATLRRAPIWDSLESFDGTAWRGVVDLIVAGFPCFTAGTMVLTETGYRPIESVVVGDYVLTHTGNWQRVTSTMRRPDAELVAFQAGSPRVVTTKEHPFYSRIRTQKWNRREFSEPEWSPIGDLGTDHFIAQVLPPIIPGQRDLSLWWLIGRYLADGWIVDRQPRGVLGRRVQPTAGRVVICCARHEADELEKRIHSAGFTASRVDEKTIVKWHITDSRFYHSVQTFGRHAHGKVIPRHAFELPVDATTALLEGYLSGDGHRVDSGWDATTVSKALALGIALLAQRAFGIVATVNRHEVSPTTVIEGRTVKQRPWYRVSIPDHNRSAFIDGDYGWRKLRRAPEPAGRGEVFNLSVEHDESYIADGFVVHNCQPTSQAGRRLGVNDERWIWDDIARIIEEVQPTYLFLENVSGLLSDASSNADGVRMDDDADESADGGGMGALLRSLAELGFDAEWTMLRASEVGPPHPRARVFIFAWRMANRDVPRFGELRSGDHDDRPDASGHHADRRRTRARKEPMAITGGLSSEPPRESGVVAEPGREASTEAQQHERGGDAADDCGAALAHPVSERLEGLKSAGATTSPAVGGRAPLGDELPLYPPGRTDFAEWRRVLAVRADLAPVTESAVRRVADGTAADVDVCVCPRTDPLRVLGNAVVPIQAAVALQALLQRAGLNL